MNSIVDVPIKGLNYPIISEMSLLGKHDYDEINRDKNIFETSLYAQANNLIHLSSPDIHIVANAVKEEEPTDEFINYAVDNGLSEDVSEAAYRQLRRKMTHDWIMAKEILAWRPSGAIHPRIVYNVSCGETESHLIPDYRIVEIESGFLGRKKDYEIDIRGCKLPIKVKWSKEIGGGKLPDETAVLLGTIKGVHVSTGVYADSNEVDFEEGLRILLWNFESFYKYKSIYLDSGNSAWKKPPQTIPLLGRKLAGDRKHV